MTKHYATLNGIKRAAIKLKRRTGMSHGGALEQIARNAGYRDYFSARQAYAEQASGRISSYAITIYEFWSDRAAGTRGNESRTFLLDKPLCELVKPHQLSGYLGGAKLSGDNTIIGYGDSRSREQARLEICRTARALQFMSATGLKPSRGGRCYPKGDQNNRPPGTDHDHGWYHPPTRSFLLTEEPYPGRHQSHAEARKIWAQKHGWETVLSPWGSIYGFGTELYLTAKANSFDLPGIARGLAALPAPFSEEEWSGDEALEAATEKTPMEIIEMSPELSALLKHQRDLDIADAGPQAPELAGDYRGVDLSSRWDIKHELLTMRRMVDGMSDLVRERVQSIWCDSNAQANYSVTIAPGGWQEAIEFDVRDAVRAATDGFNGLAVEGDGNHKQFNPEWDGDDYNYGDEAPSETTNLEMDDF